MIYDTIAAIATAMSPAGIGIIRISGENSIEIAEKIFKYKNHNKDIRDAKSHTLHYGYIVDNEGNEIDEVLLSVMKAPNSYTTENIVEINAHGGLIVMQKILRLVLVSGARLAEPGEFTKRAFINGRLDLSQAEAVNDMINSKSEMALEASLSQLKGAVADKIQAIKDTIIQLIAHIEASIDYPEYDIEELSDEHLEKEISTIIIRVKELSESYDDGKRIKEGIKTVIAGKPNVGKSSLLNTLIKEQRAIVTDIPGTTRDVLEEYMYMHGIPLKLMDTAGIRDTEDIVEKIGVQRSRDHIGDAELILLVIDASLPLSQEDIDLLISLRDRKTIIILNKTDLEQQVSLEQISEYAASDSILPISVKTMDGINQLELKIKQMFLKGKINFNNQVYITNTRHKSSLENALISLNNVKNAIEASFPVDLIAIDLTNAYNYICEITGDNVKEDMIKQIFSQFCLGK